MSPTLTLPLDDAARQMGIPADVVDTFREAGLTRMPVPVAVRLHALVADTPTELRAQAWQAAGNGAAVIALGFR